MSHTYNAILVDDEKHSLQLLRQKIERNCPEIRILAEFINPLDALERLREERPDVLFLDIEMPYYSGFDLLREVGNIDFEVIFTTAYNEFAIAAIRVSALDYLMKPIVVEELKQAVDRLRQRSQQGTPAPDFSQLFAMIQQQSRRKLPIPTTEGIELLDPEQILYCESSGNYCYIRFEDGSHMLTSKTLKEIAGLLPESHFHRIHQSYLVNFNFVRKYLRSGGGYLVLNNGKELKVSKHKKEQVMDFIYKLNKT